jgi:hypothetical protein
VLAPPRGIRAGLTALAACAALALSGCGIISVPLSGLGGSSPSATPTPAPMPSLSESPVPASDVVQAPGQCTTDDYEEQMLLSSVHPVICERGHYGETVHVGQFTGAAATIDRPPTLGDEQYAAVQNAAYLDCSAKATAYLGHSWIHMLVELRMTVPRDTAWADGQRWYRCDLYQTDWTTGDLVERTGSLKTNWFGPVCVNQNRENWPVVDCASRHPGEFTGGYLADAKGSVPDTDAEYDPYHKKCRSVVGAYLGVSAAKAYSLVGDSVSFLYDQDDWAYGRRVVHCFLWTGKRQTDYVTGSAKGRKGKGL